MKIFKIIVGLCLLTNSSFGQVVDDDFLLMVVPSIVAATKNEAGLEKVKLLHGRWKFSFDSSSGFIDYYRFDRATARASTDPSIYLIDGQGSLEPDFDGNWCSGGLIGSYSTVHNEYLVLCDWGYPSYDTGSAFFFANVANTFPLTHYYYEPSTGLIDTYPDDGYGQRVSSSYFKMSLNAETNSALENQTIADQKKTRYEEFAKLSASQVSSAKALIEGSHVSSAQAQIKAVSNLLNLNGNP